MTRAIPLPVRTAAVWTAIGFVLAILLAATVPLALGDRSYTVLSGSMAPSIEAGDVVVVEPISPAAARVGDIVAFDTPGRPLTSHRVRSTERSGPSFHFVTQGDSNKGQERWNVPVGGEIGKVRYRIPKLGFAVSRIQSTGGRIGLIVAPALLLAASLLVRIWRSQREGDGFDRRAA